MLLGALARACFFFFFFLSRSMEFLFACLAFLISF
jgi:hypothetical protein